MPKIDVNENLFFQILGRKYGREELEKLLPAAKAELDDWPEGQGVLRIELNDTNRPDLWSTMGLARQLSLYLTGKAPSYPFFSRPGKAQDAGGRSVVVDAGLKEVRPYIGSFVVEGKKVTDELLREIIQSQEKLCGNFGRKRKMIAMGVSRAELIQWPVRYGAADPDSTRFIPLDSANELTLRQILSEHAKGREYGHLVTGHKKFPLLSDGKGEVLTFPPVINSARIGGVQVGDSRLFIDLTGPDLDIILTACAIAACDFADMGFTVLPVEVKYPWDTPLGRTVVTPFYFQKSIEMDAAAASRRLGDEMTPEQAAGFIRKMGSGARVEGKKVVVSPPEYRNDFMHPVDAMEEIMIGRGMESFEPVMPRELTIGRLTAGEERNRKVRDVMIGMGYQEMIFNYLGSMRDFSEKMGLPHTDVLEIANPMSESGDSVRNSILPCLLAAEAVSANAVFPHKIFEVGKIVVKDPADNQGCRTLDSLGLLWADRQVGFNEVDAHVLALFYYLSLEPKLAAVEDPRFLPGRTAQILVSGRPVGIMGEVHPRCLESWGITMPCAAAEIHLDELK